MIAPNNVAVYAALCSLAAFDREQLQSSVISSASFKQFLELEPQIRDIVSHFYHSRYGQCLALMDEIKVGRKVEKCAHADIFSETIARILDIGKTGPQI